MTRLRPLGPRRPLHLVFAVDTSTSMAGPPLAAAIAAGQRLLDAVGSTDKVGLVEFDGSARTVTPLTGNVQAVQAALSSLTTHPGTALYDGIGDAARLTGPADGSRRVVVVLSDGDDTTSATSLDDLTAALARRAASRWTRSASPPPGRTRPPRCARSRRPRTAPTSRRRASPALEPIAARLAQTRLAGEWAVDVALPHSSSRDARDQPARRAAGAGGAAGRRGRGVDLCVERVRGVDRGAARVRRHHDAGDRGHERGRTPAAGAHGTALARTPRSCRRRRRRRTSRP